MLNVGYNGLLNEDLYALRGLLRLKHLYLQHNLISEVGAIFSERNLGAGLLCCQELLTLSLSYNFLTEIHAFSLSSISHSLFSAARPQLHPTHRRERVRWLPKPELLGPHRLPAARDRLLPVVVVRLVSRATWRHAVEPLAGGHGLQRAPLGVPLVCGAPRDALTVGQQPHVVPAVRSLRLPASRLALSHLQSAELRAARRSSRRRPPPLATAARGQPAHRTGALCGPPTAAARSTWPRS